MKKLLFIVLAFTMVFSMAACSKTEPTTPTAPTAPAAGADAGPAAPDGYPGGKNINIIVGYGAGGASDVCARTLVPYLEDILGTTVTVINKPGSGSWIAWKEVMAMKPDGYNLTFVNTGMSTTRLNPEAPYEEDITDLEVLAGQCSDNNVLGINPKDTRFNDLASLIEYAKTNEVTYVVTGVGTEDQIAVEKINVALGTKFVPVIMSNGTVEGLTAVMGGHVDVISCNCSEIITYNANNEIKAICYFGEERSVFLPDVPTFEEVGGILIDSFSARGFAMPAGGDPELVEYLSAAFEEAMSHPDYIADMSKMYLDAVYMSPDELLRKTDVCVSNLEQVADRIGW